MADKQILMHNKECHWVSDAHTFGNLLSKVDDVIAIDTESDHMYSYRPRLCLLQIALPHGIILADPFTLGLDGLQPLFEIFENPNIIKVMHSGRNDIYEIDRTYGFSLINNLFDTQVAARFLGESGAPLSWMLQSYFGVTTQKQFQKYDWRRRPIPNAARHYAAMDVAYLLEAREIQLKLLEEVGWLEPCLQTCNYIGTSTHYVEAPFDEDGWSRFGGINQLDRKGRRILRYLYRIRHRFCLMRNTPAYQVADDKTLMSVAKAKPTTVMKLRKFRGFSKNFLLRHEEDIVRSVAKALRQKGIDLPEKNHTPAVHNQGETSYNQGEKMSFAEASRSPLYVRLREWRNEKARELNIPTYFVATNSVLLYIVRIEPLTREEFAQVHGFLPWHVDFFGEEIIALVKKLGKKGKE